MLARVTTPIRSFFGSAAPPLPTHLDIADLKVDSTLKLRSRDGELSLEVAIVFYDNRLLRVISTTIPAIEPGVVVHIQSALNPSDASLVDAIVQGWDLLLSTYPAFPPQGDGVCFFLVGVDLLEVDGRLIFETLHDACN